MKKRYRCEIANAKCHSMGQPRSQQQPAHTDLIKCFSLKFIFRCPSADRRNEFKTFSSQCPLGSIESRLFRRNNKVNKRIRNKVISKCQLPFPTEYIHTPLEKKI